MALRLLIFKGKISSDDIQDEKTGLTGCGEKKDKKINLTERTKVVAYEFYWDDKEGMSHLIGILPERRKKTERITEESIMNWGKKILGGQKKVKKIYFVEVSI